MKINLQSTIGGFNFELLRTLSYQATGGAELGECLATAGRIREGSFDSWIKEWLDTAQQAMLFGQNLLGEGEYIGARNAFLRASNYYRSAEFYASMEDPRRAEAWQKSRQCFRRASALFSPPIEPVEIPFEATSLPGYFVSGGDGKRSTLIAITGFDGSSEELYHFIGAAAATRGWHCLMFEGPGQRGALYLNPGLVMRPDFEVPVHAAVDYALKRPEVDGDRLAVVGYSLGGYFAVRGAAFEPRLRACVANPIGVDLAATWRSRLPPILNNSPRMIDGLFSLLRELKPEVRWGLHHACWAMGIQHPHELFGVHGWKPYHLWDTVDRVLVPLLILVGEDEIAASKSWLLDVLEYVQALKCEVTFHAFAREEGASLHCQIGALSRGHGVVFPWLEKRLEAGTSVREGQPRISLPDPFISIIRKYHGDKLADRFERLGAA
jgi:pimeloyl-ACP methyl ester carboxylesterase